MSYNSADLDDVYKVMCKVLAEASKTNDHLERFNTFWEEMKQQFSDNKEVSPPKTKKICTVVNREDQDKILDKLIYLFPEYSKAFNDERKFGIGDRWSLFWPNNSVHSIFLYGVENEAYGSVLVSNWKFLTTVIEQFLENIKHKEISKDSEREW